MTVITLWFGVTFDYESLTIGATAVALTSATYAPTGAIAVKRAIITVETASIRFRIDGTNPTATEGHRAKEDDIIILDNKDDIVNFRAISVTNDATIRASYKR